jgi:hypothetical protein
MDVIDFLTVTICAYGVAGCLLFITLYHLLTGGRWRRHELGWFLMVKAVDFALIMTLIGATRILGDWPGRRYVVLFLVLLFASHPWWWARIVWHAHPGQVSVMKGIAMSGWQRYGKAIMSVLGSVAVLVYLYLNEGDRQIDRIEGVQLAVVGTQSVLVYVVPLATHARWAKSVVEWVLAGLLALASVIVDGWQPWTDGIVIGIAVLTAAGVTVSPARSDNGVSSNARDGIRAG